MGLLSRILGVESASPARPEKQGANELWDRIEAVLDDVRPALHSDGGDIELIEVVGNSAKVRLTGACDGCPSAAFTLRYGIEKRLKDAIPEFEDLIPV